MAERGITWRESFARLRRDRDRLRRYQVSKFGYAPATWFLDPAFVCVCFYRLSHLMWCKGHRKAGRLFVQLNSLLTGADITPDSDLGGGLLIPSPCGVTISGKAGDDLVALALAGIGGSVRDKDIGAGLGLPVLGNNVTAGQFTGTQGSIHLGDEVTLEAGAGAVISLPPGSRMVIAVEPRAGDPPAPRLRPRGREGPCGHATWRRTRAAFGADIARYVDELSRYGASSGRARQKKFGAILSNPLLAILVYRLSHWLYLNGHRRIARALCRVNILFHKLTIPPQSCLGGGLLMPHLAGTIVCARAGANLTLYANSLCTAEEDAFCASMAESPDIGGNVMVGGHSGIFGAVSVGDRVTLGPKAQLAQDAPDGTTVWSPMARGSERRSHVPNDTGSAAAAHSPGVLPDPAAPRLPADRPWRETRRRLKEDRLRRVRCGTGVPAEPPVPATGFPASTCVRLYRLSHYFYFTGHRRLARWCWLLNIYLTGADIAPCCEIGAGLSIPHPAGIALHCRAGDDLTVMAASGIGASLDREGRLRNLDETPQLGDGIRLSHHSGIYGAVTVGGQVKLAPGCILTRSTAAGINLVPRSLKFRATAAVWRERASHALSGDLGNAGSGTPRLMN